MQHRDTEQANAVGKMVPNSCSTYSIYKKKHSILEVR